MIVRQTCPECGKSFEVDTNLRGAFVMFPDEWGCVFCGHITKKESK